MHRIAPHTKKRSSPKYQVPRLRNFILELPSSNNEHKNEDYPSSVIQSFLCFKTSVLFIGSSSYNTVPNLAQTTSLATALTPAPTPVPMLQPHEACISKDLTRFPSHVPLLRLLPLPGPLPPVPHPPHCCSPLSSSLILLPRWSLLVPSGLSGLSPLVFSLSQPLTVLHSLV